MLQIDGPAPYAPTSAVTAVIERHRERGLQTVDLQTLQRMSVSDSLAPRTLQALKLLGLIDEDGRPTDEFEKIRIAPSDAYQSDLADLLRASYGPVFDIVDPVTASPAQVEDAFRGFTPAGQRPRMVALFTGLLAYAGLVESQRSRPGPKPRVGTAQKRSSGNAAAAPASRRTTNAQDAAGDEPARPSRARGDEHTVELTSGGRVTVELDVNLFNLSATDREFVFGLIDAVRGYREANGAADLDS